VDKSSTGHRIEAAELHILVARKVDSRGPQ
jgi:hypothetical protein